MAFSKLTFVALVLTGFSSGAAEAASTPDPWITTKLEIELVTTSHVRARDVYVDTIDGRVTLYGTVDTAQKKQNAGSVAEGIKGVRQVRNLLRVVPESKQAIFPGADDRIETRIENLLKRDVSLRGSAIQVKSVNKGMALLTGKAKNLIDYWRAVELTSGVSGVRSVNSTITSPDDLPDVDSSTFAGGVANSALDLWITTATKRRLLADPEVPALAINVVTHQGVVTLFGMVPTASAEGAAVAQAKKVDFVVAVKDELEVAPETKQAFVDAMDYAIERDVQVAFMTRTDTQDIDVRVENGMVHLTGNVGSAWRRLQAATIARAIEGVRSVADDLPIEPRG